MNNMLARWDVEVGGRNYSVSVDHAENGKDNIRVDGRVIARPMAPEESERQITVAGVPYVVRRMDSGEFDLQFEAIDLSDGRTRTLDTARTAPAHGNAPVSLKRHPISTRLPYVGWAVIVALVGVVLFYATGPSYEKQAMQRMRIVLHEMQPGTGPETQFAVPFWARGRKIINAGEMSWASDNFDKWRRARNIDRKLGDYEVLRATMVKGEKVPTAIVTFRLEGKEYKVRVPKDLPIAWEE